MSELGQRLREARESRGISLEDLQKTTKIQKRYLAAIEEGKYDTLPGKYYARACVKSYADAVGIDTDELFDEFSNELPNPQKGSSDLPSRTKRTKSTTVKPRRRGKLSAIMPVVIALTFLLVIGVGVWIMAQQWGNDQAEGIAPEEQEQPFEGELGEELVPEEQPEDTPVEEEPTPTEEVPIEEPVEEIVQQELTLIRTTRNHSYYELSNTNSFEIEISFTGTSYVGIKNAKGKSFFAGEAKAGDILTYDFTGEEEIEFNYGASNYVQMKVNDEVLEFPLDIIHQKVTISFLPVIQ